MEAEKQTPEEPVSKTKDLGATTTDAPLDELMTALDDLIVDLSAQWRLHRELFQVDGHSPLFEKSGWHVWGILHDALIESVFMCISRLFDPSASCGKGNLSFAQILKHFPKNSEQTQIQQDCERIRGLYNPALKRWRDWKISHNSLKTLRGIDPLPDVSYAELGTLIDGINQFAKSLGAVVRTTFQTYVPVSSYGPVIPNQDWVRTLIKVLEGGTERMLNKK